MRNFSPVERVLAMWMVGVVVAVSVAAAALVMTNKLVYGPTGQVREYFMRCVRVMVRMLVVCWVRRFLRVTHLCLMGML